MKILIVDDEPLARLRLRRLVAEIGGHTVVGEAASGKEALLRSAELKPDVLLLDIRMPDMDGLETAGHLMHLEPPPAVIFTTAYGEHALEAFEAQAVDYLLKPIRREKLDAALGKARKVNRAQLVELGKADDLGHARTHISAQVSGKLQIIPLQDIRYFQADQKYVTVRHGSGEVLIDDSLKTLEDEFGERLLRIHRNALVVVAQVEALLKTADGTYQVRLRGIPELLEVSRRHIAAVRKQLKGM